MEPGFSESAITADDTLDRASKTVGALSAAVAVAGVAGAVPSLGTSLLGASAGIVLLQAINGGYQYIKRQTDEPFMSDETKLDDIYLSLNILLRRVAYLTAVRYRHFIDEILEEKSITTFANFVAERAMKALEAQSNAQVDITTALKAEDFLDYFLASVKLSFLHESTKLDIKKEYSQTGCLFSTTTYAKWACSRPGLAIYDESLPPQYTLYESTSNIIFPGHHTSLYNQYGFITAPLSELTSQTAAISRIKLKPLNPDIMDDILQKNKQHFCVYYQVSRQDVSDYLAKARASILANQPLQSLNEYLSETMNANIIAICHDDRLRGMDLSGGDFSETMFEQVDLSECNLQDTLWTRAHLNAARFKKNELSGSNFQHAYIEKSLWEEVNFSGNFSHAKLNGSKITNCLIKTSFNQIGIEWNLVQLNNVTKEDSAQLLTVKFEEQRQENLQTINQNITTQLNNMHHESLPSYFNFRWNTDINTSFFKKIKETYIPLNIMSGAGENTPMRLTDRFEAFLNNDEQFLLLHGDVGSGKTLSVALWQEKLMEHFKKETDWLPLYIRLIDLQGQTSNTNFLKAALQTVLDQQQIKSLMENFRCVLICDALEESGLTDLHQILKQCSDLNAYWKKGYPKILVTAQTRYLLANSNEEEDYHDLLNINSNTKFPFQSECILQPFNSDQIQQYLTQYESQDIEFSNRYNTLKQNERSITAMSKNPLMLHIICEVLSPAKTLTTSRRHYSSHSPLNRDSLTEHSSSPIPWNKELATTSRLEFYNAFFKRWHHEEKHKLAKSTVNYSSFQQFIQDVAFTMYSTNQDWIEQSYTDEDCESCKTNEDELSLFLLSETQSKKMTSMLTPFTVSIRETTSFSKVLHYEFSHLSFKHYALAKRLFNILVSTDYTDKEKLDDWNHHFLTSSPDVFNFLTELIENHPSIKTAEKTLLYMIKASKGFTGLKYERAASNAITLLNRWFDFSMELEPRALSGTHLRHADLSHGNFTGMSFDNCDLTGVMFAHAKLSNCSMRRTNLKDTRFSNRLSFVYTDTQPSSFTVHPHDNEDIIAYDLKPTTSNEPYHNIALSSLAGQINHVFSGHKAPIACMAMTHSGDDILLASASKTGTIRVWEVPVKPGSRGREINKLQDKTESISSLAWSEDGCFLASTGEYGTVQIWDVAQKTIIWQSERYPFIMRCVIWDHANNAIIAAGDDGMIRTWSESARHTAQQPEVFRNNTPAIYSLALSSDGKKLISGCANGMIYIQEKNMSSPVETLAQHAAAVTSLACKNHRLASGSDDTTVRIWDLENNECIAVFHDPESRKVNQVNWLSNDDLMSGVDGGSKLRIWSSTSQSVTLRYPEKMNDNAMLSVQNCNVAGAQNLSRTTARFLSERGALVSIPKVNPESLPFVRSNSLENLIKTKQSFFSPAPTREAVEKEKEPTMQMY